MKKKISTLLLAGLLCGCDGSIEVVNFSVSKHIIEKHEYFTYANGGIIHSASCVECGKANQ